MCGRLNAEWIFDSYHVCVLLFTDACWPFSAGVFCVEMAVETDHEDCELEHYHDVLVHGRWLIIWRMYSVSLWTVISCVIQFLVVLLRTYAPVQSARTRLSFSGTNPNCPTASFGYKFHFFYAAFTPDTCSPDISCIRLYPFVSPVAVYMYPVSATKLSSRLHVSTCIRE